MDFFFFCCSLWMQSTTPFIVIRTKIIYFEWLKICKHSWSNNLSGNEIHCCRRAGFRCDPRTLRLLCKKPRGCMVSIPEWEENRVLSREMSPLLNLRTRYGLLDFPEKQNFKKLGEGLCILSCWVWIIKKFLVIYCHHYCIKKGILTKKNKEPLFKLNTLKFYKTSILFYLIPESTLLYRAQRTDLDLYWSGHWVLSAPNCWSTSQAHN